MKDIVRVETSASFMEMHIQERGYLRLHQLVLLGSKAVGTKTDLSMG
jgi:hypothetical protein